MYKGEYVDLSYLTALSDGDVLFMEEMIATFLKDSPEITNSLVVNSKEGNWDKVAEIAHKFKTSLMFMGIKSLSEVIRQIEKSARSGEGIESVPMLSEKVADHCNRAVRELNEYIKKSK